VLRPVAVEFGEEAVKAHYDYYSGEPLDEDLYQAARADELQAMEDYGVMTVVPISQASDGKHVGGFPIAHMKDKKVRWRFVATEVAHELREDNHQGTPPLMVVRAILSRAASKPDGDGVHRRLVKSWDVRKAFFNADLDEIIYVHPGKELCAKGYCWRLHKALYGTRKASQLWGETVKSAMDDNGFRTVRGIPGTYYLPSTSEVECLDCVVCCHGDDFLAEGHEEQLQTIDEVLKTHFEVTESGCIGPNRIGAMKYLKRTCGYADQLPETGLPGYYWIADQKNVDDIVKWGNKSGSKPAPSPGTKATGTHIRTALDPLPTTRAKEVASCGGLALYVSADRPDTMFASKTVMQHVSKPNVAMEARMMRLSRYYAGRPTLCWCYELQEQPDEIRVDGDSDWAPNTEELRRSTSGGTIRYGEHLWDAFSVTQATQALSSGEAEFYSTGSAVARGLMAVGFMKDTGRDVALVAGSDSTAGRGICQRHGVGKVRHLELRYLWLQDRVRLKQLRLEKVESAKMVADFLTKYSEEEVIKRHCHTLNLRFVTRTAMIVTMFVSTEAAGEICAVGAGTCMMKPEGMERHDLNIELILFASVIAVVAFVCGSLVTIVVFIFYKRSHAVTVRDAEAMTCVDPVAPVLEVIDVAEAYFNADVARDPFVRPYGVGSAARGDQPVGVADGVGSSGGRLARLVEEPEGPVTLMPETDTLDQNVLRRQNDSAYKVMMALLHAELKRLCRGHRLPVSGTKPGLTMRLIEAEVAPTENQCRHLLYLERCLLERGMYLLEQGKRRPTVRCEDVATREAMSRFLSRLEAALYGPIGHARG